MPVEFTKPPKADLSRGVWKTDKQKRDKLFYPFKKTCLVPEERLARCP